ncbi:MAG: helix-turn-helix transcriptional regulator [Tepidisphaeraceae bacterium]
MRKSVYTAEYTALRTALRESRDKAGLSQRQLAERLKVPHSWVAKVESGERRIDLVECGWFLAACGVDPLAVFKRLVQQYPASSPRRVSKGGR